MTTQHATILPARQTPPRRATALIRRAAVLAIVALGLTTVLLGTGANDASAQTNWEQDVIDLMNDHRASLGLAPFAPSASISDGARAWSQEMSRTGFRHDTRVLALGLAENIAYAEGAPGQLWTYPPFSTAAGPLPSYCRSRMDGTTAEMFVCIWLSSTQGHREAIENPSYRQVGVGRAFTTRGSIRETFLTARFSTVAPAPIASFSSPGHNTRLCSGDEVSWSGPSSGKYRLQIGTSRNGDGVMNEPTSKKSMDVLPLPSDRTLYATLRYRPDGGSWTTVDQRTFSPCANPVVLNTTSRLCSGDEVTWSGPSSARYRLRISTSYDGKELMNDATTGRSIDAAPNLPAGRDLYVSLREKGSDGVWRLRDTHVYQPCSRTTVFVSPNANARLCDNDLIDWDGRSSGKYRIRIGTSPDGEQILNEPTSKTKYNVGNLPNTSGTLYVSLRYRAEVGGSWALQATMELRSC